MFVISIDSRARPHYYAHFLKTITKHGFGRISVTSSSVNKTRKVGLMSLESVMIPVLFFSIAIPDVPFAVPSIIEHNSLNELVNQLIKENKSDFLKPKELDFLVFGELLRLPLIEHLKEHNISSETTIDIEYIERTPSPEPQESLLHDDWVSGIQTADKWYLLKAKSILL